MSKYAVRNLRLCTKDCLCLYVCPTGASDTEDSIIDTEKCIGCGRCADACPSRAISIIELPLPPQQRKEMEVESALQDLAGRKSAEEALELSLARTVDGDGGRRLMKALARSSRILGEDLVREAGFMLPQSRAARNLLEALVADPPAGFPVEAARRLLEHIECNE